MKFAAEYTDLGRSTHLLKIKRYMSGFMVSELSEKQFTFEEIVMMKYQMNKKSAVNALQNLDSSSLIMNKVK